MKRLQKYSLQIGAAAILAVAVTLVAPRAARAMAAALVQVTNTAANPAIAQSVAQLASQNVFLQSQSFASTRPGMTVLLSRTTPDGVVSSSGFVVPAGQSLVITSIEVQPGSAAGSYQFEILNGTNNNVRFISNVPDTNMTQFQFPSGIVFLAGESVVMGNGSASPGQIVIFAQGYLTSN